MRKWRLFFRRLFKMKTPFKELRIENEVIGEGLILSTAHYPDGSKVKIIIQVIPDKSEKKQKER